MRAQLGFRPHPPSLRWSQELLAQNPVVDLHAHPGRTFVRGLRGATVPVRVWAARGASEKRAVHDLAAGGVTAASFAAVGDLPVLGPTRGGLAPRREFAPGEAWRSLRVQLAALRTHLTRAGAAIALGPDDILAAHREGRVAGILTIEGADFLDDAPDELATVQRAGVRIVGLVHYRANAVADTQTSPARHGGLSPFGVEVMRELEQQGIVVDLAHASESTIEDALSVATGPVICSHTHVRGTIDHPRFIGRETALAIATHGGLVGVWPAGLGQRTLGEFVDRTFEVAQLVGPEHVALGTDMDANFRPVLARYRALPLYVSELLRRGYGERETTLLLGANALRVLASAGADDRPGR
ncbi:membrane dipeptidase [Microbacterium sp. BWT-B31]|uniref:dipeptidase n=1 Tax=Microbacterium sp. BWT-B31 TaxID=3232072 RepID=UPI003528D701